MTGKPWNGKIALDLRWVGEIYRTHGSPHIKNVDQDIAKLIDKVQERGKIAAIILAAICDDRAPSAEDLLGADFERIFMGGIMRRVASVIERQIDEETDVRKFVAGRDDEGREIWATTASELGDKFSTQSARHSLGSVVNACYAHEMNGYGGAFEHFETLVDEARRGLEAKINQKEEVAE